ncbi:hypothetical protein LX32DRAFT_645392 [Colletotrichum zoysiae]|uniref:Uncharacterized protein n=1 Tax=Colletotrichum zoysiae TaxID=1216348 RepID=A0AAD9H703_9PEZI|nr:hypothetical protein LX32DRAFT_645392 [Colletotrichum zoysiae]
MREPCRIISWLAEIPEQPPSPTSAQQLTHPTTRRACCMSAEPSRPVSPPCSDASKPARPPAITMKDSEASQARRLSTPPATRSIRKATSYRR